MGPQPTGRASERTRQLPCKLPSYIPAMVEARRPPKAVRPFLLPEAFSPSFLSFPSRAVPYEGINSNLIKSRQQRETSRRHPRLLPRCAETRNATAGTCKVHRTPSEPFAYFCLSVQCVHCRTNLLVERAPGQCTENDGRGERARDTITRQPVGRPRRGPTLSLSFGACLPFLWGVPLPLLYLSTSSGIMPVWDASYPQTHARAARARGQL